MNRIFFAPTIAIASAMFFSAMSTADSPDRVPPRRVLVIGIDGTRADALQAANTPSIDSLIEQGKRFTDTQILGDRPTANDTVSGPGWTSFLTGVWADKHGIQDNGFEDIHVDQYPHFFARVRQRFPDARLGSFVDWKPIDQHIVRDADVRVCLKSHGADQYREHDVRLADAAIDFLSAGQPHAAMVYFGAVDETGHAKGFHPSVPEYVQAIETVDGLVGKVVDAVRSREHYESEDWLFVLSTDHGGQGTGHGGGRDVPEIRRTWLITSGLSMGTPTERPTYVVDVAVTALVHLGVPIDASWELDGKSVVDRPSRR